jgi:hypothetical protein
MSIDDTLLPSTGPARSRSAVFEPTVEDTVLDFMSSDPVAREAAVLSVIVPAKLLRSGRLWEKVYMALPTAELKREWIDRAEELGL